ncbi:MAG: ATPase [Clostridiales bacterium]|nr:ATPase [Clostridiales bacterium]
MKFIAGVDGGGTKTMIECRDVTGHVLNRQRFGAFNINSIGEEGFAALLQEIFLFLQSVGECEALCIGAAGISNPKMRQLVEAAVGASGIDKWQLVGDHEIALYGALSGRPGCALISGTGSICFGRNAKGETARAGGWGHLIDDGGSGYALGRDALTAVVRQWDGRGEETRLSHMILDTLALTNRKELIAYIYGGDKSRIAALASLVDQAAKQGDRAACQIIQREAMALCELVDAVAKRLGFDRGEVALLGGLLMHPTELRRAFAARLADMAPTIHCVQPCQDAAAGAALMAAAMLR